MIVILILAALTIAYRIKAHLFTKVEGALLAVFIANWTMIELQITICDHRLFPEMRYWVEAGVLLFGWVAWGVWNLSQVLSRRFKPARFILPACVAGLAITELVMICKPHIPFARRYAYVKAAEWATERIRQDWKGPRQDVKVQYSNEEYRPLGRPIVHSHTGRVPYLLGGRFDSASRRFESDTPDYICDEERKINLKAANLHGHQYILLDRFQIGTRTFALYKRTD